MENVNESWTSSSFISIHNDNLKSIPDSISIEWFCNTDKCTYKGGFILPKKKMLKYFEKDSTISFGEKLKYTKIIVGVAPGGNSTIWLEGNYIITEIAKFKVPEIYTSLKNIQRVNDSLVQVNLVNNDLNIAHYLYGIPYLAWQKSEKEFDYDIIFCNEADKFNYSFNVIGFSKDCSIISNDLTGTDLKIVKWNQKFTFPIHNSKLHNKLPVHFFLEWSNNKNDELYKSEIVLPVDFENNFTNKNENYNRIIIGLEKTKINTPYILGHIWVSGINKQKEIMTFQAAKYDTNARKFLTPTYSLPKDYVFPKWEGREPLKTPDFEYWQEK